MAKKEKRPGVLPVESKEQVAPPPKKNNAKIPKPKKPLQQKGLAYKPSTPTTPMENQQKNMPDVTPTSGKRMSFNPYGE
jgi:hypothetical protein